MVFVFISSSNHTPIKYRCLFKISNRIIPAYPTNRYELEPFFKAGVNRVYVHLDNEPMPTGQRVIGTKLLSPCENRHSSDYLVIHIMHALEGNPSSRFKPLIVPLRQCLVRRSQKKKKTPALKYQMFLTIIYHI